MTLTEDHQHVEPPEPGVEVRFLTPEGAEGFSRLVRRCYGDSYDAARVYDPEPSIPNTDVHVDDRADHNDRVVTVRTVGDDLLDGVLARRDEALARAADCVYVDLPLTDPGTRRHGDGLRELGVRSVRSSPTACTTATCCATSTSTA